MKYLIILQIFLISSSNESRALWVNTSVYRFINTGSHHLIEVVAILVLSKTKCGILVLC